MQSTIRCGCGKLLSYKNEQAGKVVRCPGCKTPLQLQEQEEEIAEVAEVAERADLDEDGEGASDEANFEPVQKKKSKKEAKKARKKAAALKRWRPVIVVSAILAVSLIFAPFFKFATG